MNAFLTFAFALAFFLHLHSGYKTCGSQSDGRERDIRRFTELLRQLSPLYGQDPYWSYRLLTAPSVQADMALTVDQIQRIQAASERFWEVVRNPEIPIDAVAYDSSAEQELDELHAEYFRAIRDEDAERLRELGSRMTTLAIMVHNAQMTASDRREMLLNEMLHDAGNRGLLELGPRQMERLEQILLHVRLGEGQPFGVFRNSRIRDYVDISEVEQQELASKAAHFAPEFRHHVQTLLARYHRQIQEVLPPEQRAGLRILISHEQPVLTPEVVQRLLSYDALLQMSGPTWQIESYLDRCQRCVRILPFPVVSVREEITLTEGQVTEIGLSAASRDHQRRELLSRPREVLAEILDAAEFEQMDEEQLRELMFQRLDEINREHHEFIVELLLPHQRMALARVLVEYEGNRDRPFGIYHRAEMAAWFDISGDQQHQLAEAARRAWPAFFREFTELLVRYDTRIRNELSAESRDKWENSFGPPFVLIECGVLP